MASINRYIGIIYNSIFNNGEKLEDAISIFNLTPYQTLNLAKSENKYKHAGVAAHPGNYGMKNITERA
jgi:hypothetical protein